MAFELTLAIKGDLPAFAKGLAKAQAKVATNVNRKAARRTRKRLRAKIKSGFAKARNPRAQVKFEDTIIVRDDPRRGYALKNSSRVFCVARYSKRRRQKIDLLTVFSEGADIKPVGHKWLPIPTENAPPGKGHGKYARPEEYPNKFFMKISATLAYYIDNFTHKILWVLVPFVKIAARIDARGIHADTSAKMQDDFSNQLVAETAKLLSAFSAAG